MEMVYFLGLHCNLQDVGLELARAGGVQSRQ